MIQRNSTHRGENAPLIINASLKDFNRAMANPCLQESGEGRFHNGTTGGRRPAQQKTQPGADTGAQGESA
ncbi:hypothetical protein [Marimonas lutisalis]|uniref:hypothetical protein n=1 Tax=Marimonas lutisalis TaxID=2545756 RepID=UPI0010FA61AD|nr:hypothetical protein [Marimonas lutisalis]